MTLNTMRTAVTALAVFETDSHALKGVLRLSFVEHAQAPHAVWKHQDGAENAIPNFETEYCWSTVEEIEDLFASRARNWSHQVPQFLKPIVQNFDGAPESILEHASLSQNCESLGLVMLPCEPWERPSSELSDHLVKTRVRREWLSDAALRFIDALSVKMNARQYFKRVG